MSRAEFERIAQQLAGLKGRFILSINDMPEFRETFAAFPIASITTTCPIRSGPARPGRNDVRITKVSAPRQNLSAAIIAVAH